MARPKSLTAPKTAEVSQEQVRLVPAENAGVMQAISKAELDQQITTARAYPRSLRKFVDECMDMATLNERVASECIYALPRGGKTIEGPSARLAEIVASAWGNCRAAARVVEEGAEFITAQGIFQDLERNVSITYEVRRRIINRDGKRYDADMIAVTGNAACSIALRNAVFKGVPKAFWSDIYDAARKAAIGDVKTIANKRADAVAYFGKMGITPELIFRTLGVSGIEDIGTEQLATLRGLMTAIKDGETTIDEAFAPREGKGGTAPPREKQAPAQADLVQAAAAPAMANAEQRAYLEKLLDGHGIPLSELLARYEIGDLTELPFESVVNAMEWIKKVASGL